MKRLPAASSAWAWFLDVDGTLVDLAETPAAIDVGVSLLALIEALRQASGGAVALVSGRTLADLDRRFRLPQLAMAGQHGLERRDAFGHIHRHSLSPVCCDWFLQRLEPLLARHPGLRVECKGATLAVHYRLAPRLGGYVHRLLGELAAQSPGLEVQPGKRVVEVKPAGFDKGSAILEYMAQPPFRGRRPAFVGDDLTDEHGFALVNRLEGISVKVGPGRSKARYRLRDVGAVHAWIRAALPADSKETA